MASSFERLTAKQVRDNYREQFFVADLEKPTIVDAMAGDPDGLIHKDKLGAALNVTIPLWDDRPVGDKWKGARTIRVYRHRHFGGQSLIPGVGACIPDS